MNHRRAAFVICAGVALAFWPALSAGFVWDDRLLVPESPLVRGPFLRIWTSTDAYDFWPLTTSAFWVQWRLFGEFAPAYHAVNLALHLCAALLLWRILEDLRVPGAWIAGLLFAVHPAAVESAAWISEQKNTLSAVLAFAAVLAWVRDRRRLSLAVFVLALLAKGSVVVIPIVLAGIELWRGRRRLQATVPFLVASALAGLGNLWFQHHNAMAAHPAARKALLDRVAGSAWALLAYEQKAFLPARLGVVYPEWPGPPLLYASLLLVPAVATALVLSRRRGILAAFALHALAVAPVLGLVELAYFDVGPISNHLQYLALCAPAALYGAALARLRPALIAAPVAAIAIFTSSRAIAWRSDATLWRAAVAEQPRSAYARSQLSVALAGEGRYEEAAAELDEQIRLTRDPSARALAAAQLAWFRGQRAEAVAQARAAIESSSDAAVRADAADVLLAAGFADEAIAALRNATAASPANAEFAYRLGAALARSGRGGDAQAVLRAFDREHPGSPRIAEALRVVTSPR